MGTPAAPTPIETPSGKRIAAAAGAALVVAAVVLVTAVLPAEYGVDPLGTGKALGLLALFDASELAASPPPAGTPSGDAAPAPPRPRSYKIDSSEMALGPGQAFEYKYRLDKGAGMVYAWHTSGRVKYEFHGEPDDHTLRVETYEKSENDYASGTLTAPFTGIHGWYWENLEGKAITIGITSTGFFTSAEELRPKWDPVKHKNRVEHIPHELTTPEK
jgi:hypothetical protein